MADFTHSSRSYVSARATGRGAPRIKNIQESTAASTAVIGFGQVVQYDPATATSNFRIIRSSTSNGQTPVNPVNVAGVAAEGSTSDGSTTGLSDPKARKLAIWVADGETEFSFPTKLLCASSLVNTGLELSWDSTLNIHHLSANSTAGDLVVMVTEIDQSKCAIGDTGGYLIGRFYSSVVARNISAL